MTSSSTEHLPPHAGGPGTSSFARPRDARVLEHTREAAADALAGRTVWCLSALASGAVAAETVDVCLCAPEADGIATRRLHLDAPAVAAPGSLDLAALDALLGGEIAPGDVVVMHDRVAALLVESVRARGAHALWQLQLGERPDALPRGLDACVAHAPAPASGSADRLAAVLPAPGHLAVMEVECGRYGAGLGWRALLAGVVGEDRDEAVGGTLRARPHVPPR
ncbi:hypothetical protein Q5424_11385 [Conexibacter sp. JD483]|uniref:hypothetical protein n=1 Tax=unclassified Conexibacter TaxID=2627773 RepID=UPI0027292DEE|nr:MULTISPECIES: hypothetical protein [unclassified Conexibacter]MDO8187901.1 hypothetical protein [Conexibacter sp. CPCC 205706]MDO8198648.1 hypothetical protein [Conexibacter sp. CPCC 205762]MDR9369688.1 hypothetical protein [Conexibacter sp. JD483]